MTRSRLRAARGLLFAVEHGCSTRAASVWFIIDFIFSCYTTYYVALYSGVVRAQTRAYGNLLPTKRRVCSLHSVAATHARRGLKSTKKSYLPTRPRKEGGNPRRLRGVLARRGASLHREMITLTHSQLLPASVHPDPALGTCRLSRSSCCAAHCRRSAWFAV